MAQTCAIDGTFEAEYQPPVVLEIVTDMGAADHALGSAAKRAPCQLIAGPSNGVAAPGVADLASNVEAVPRSEPAGEVGPRRQFR
jgi:hypothetical protein